MTVRISTIKSSSTSLDFSHCGAMCSGRSASGFPKAVSFYPIRLLWFWFDQQRARLQKHFHGNGKANGHRLDLLISVVFCFTIQVEIRPNFLIIWVGRKVESRQGPQPTSSHPLETVAGVLMAARMIRISRIGILGSQGENHLDKMQLFSSSYYWPVTW